MSEDNSMDIELGADEVAACLQSLEEDAQIGTEAVKDTSQNDDTEEEPPPSPKTKETTSVEELPIGSHFNQLLKEAKQNFTRNKIKEVEDTSSLKPKHKKIKKAEHFITEYKKQEQDYINFKKEALLSKILYTSFEYENELGFVIRIKNNLDTHAKVI